MFNLLPKTEKEAIRREYRIRLAVVGLWLLFAACAISSLLLLPSFLLSSEKEKVAENRFEMLSKSAEQSDVTNLAATLQDTKSLLALIHSKAPRLFLHELLMLIVSIKTDRISLTRFSFEKPADGAHAIDIQGVAKDRGALLAFAKALEQTKLFEKVEVPFSNFAKDMNIDFSVRASGDF